MRYLVNTVNNILVYQSIFKTFFIKFINSTTVIVVHASSSILFFVFITFSYLAHVYLYFNEMIRFFLNNLQMTNEKHVYSILKVDKYQIINSVLFIYESDKLNSDVFIY